jgi:hypothetical protein
VVRGDPALLSPRSLDALQKFARTFQFLTRELAWLALYVFHFIVFLGVYTP